MGKDVEKANDGVPQPAVGQRLLVACAGALVGREGEPEVLLHSSEQAALMIFSHLYLNVFS